MDTLKKCRAKGCQTLYLSHTTDPADSIDFFLDFKELKAGLWEGLLDVRRHLS